MFGISTDNSDDIRGIGTAAIHNAWHHIAAVFVNGSPTAVKLYVDGTLQTLTQTGAQSTSNAYVTTTFFIGAENGNNSFSGSIDELKVYSGELTASQIIALYTETHVCSSCSNGSSAISLVSANAPSPVSSSAVSSLAFAKPTGTATNSLLIAAVNAYRSGSSSCATITAPSGWTKIREDTKSSSAFFSSYCMKQGVYYKLATASEPASYSFTFSSSAYADGVIAAYSGVDVAAPIMTSSGQGNSSTYSITAPSVTTSRNGARLLGFFGSRKGNVSITPPGCMTEQIETATGSSSGVTLEMADSPWGVLGVTGTRVASASISSESIGQLVVLQPPVAILLPGAYNAFDTSTVSGSITGYVKSKVAGTAFSLAIVALNAARSGLYTTGGGYAGTVKVELLGNSSASETLDGNNCPSSSTPLHSGTLTYVTGDVSRKNFSVPAISEAWRNVRVRISYPSTGTAFTISCSTDNFAIRPASFGSVAAKDSTWVTTGTARTLNNTGSTGGSVHAAGAPFTLTATAVNSAGNTTTNYNGTPTVSVTACPLPAGCAIDGTGSYSPGIFDSGTMTTSSGVVTSTDASYGEVGTLSIQLVDESFAAVDASDGTTADCSGRYVCSSTATIGRFVPAAFSFSFNDPSGTAYPSPQLLTFGSNSCASRSFTYVGQPFGYAQVPQVLLSAVNAGGDTTANYLGFESVSSTATVTATYPTPTLTRIDNGATLTSPPTFDTSAAGTPTVTSNGDGTAIVAIPTSASLKFEHSSQVVPYTAAINLSLDASDTSETGVTIMASATADFSPLAFDAGDVFRYGRLRLSNAYGSVSPIYMPVEAQYWSGLSWIKNTADSCTTSTGGTPQVSFPPLPTGH